MAHQEEKHKFLNKLRKPFRSHSRSSSLSKSEVNKSPSSSADRSSSSPEKASGHSNILKAAYEEGQRKFKRENNSTSSQSHAIKENHSGSHDPHVIAELSTGRLLDTPPRVHRNAVTRDPGGDFTGDKNPTDLVYDDDGNAKGPDTKLEGTSVPMDKTHVKGLRENDNPNYGNDAKIEKGTGYYYDPRDTQGGVYHHVGAHDDATRAHLEKNRNLKTQPSAYMQLEKEKEKDAQVKEIKDQAYEEGQKKGKSESRRQEAEQKDEQETVDGGDKSLDPGQEHSRNKSAFNEAGASSAEDELNSKGRASGVGATAAGATAGSASHEKNKDKSLKNPQDANTGAETGSVSAFNNSKDSPAHSKGLDQNKNSTNSSDAPLSPADKNFSYDSELKKLDKQIESTQAQIEGLDKDGASTKTLNDVPLDAESKSSASHESAGITGALAATAAAAASYVGFGRRKTSGEEDIVKEAYEAGIKSGSYEAGLSAGKDGANVKSSSKKTSVGSKLPSDNQGVSSESASKELNSDGTEKPGPLDGAKGALSAGAGAAAGALGYDNSKKDTPDSRNIKKPDLKSTLSGGSDAKDLSDDYTEVSEPNSYEDRNIDSVQIDTKSGGFLGSLGWGHKSSKPEESVSDQSSKRSDKVLEEKSNTTTTNEGSASPNSRTGIIAGVGSAIGVAAGAVGLLKSSSNRDIKNSYDKNNEDSLINTAEKKYDDVAEQPAHTNEGGLLKRTNDQLKRSPNDKLAGLKAPGSVEESSDSPAKHAEADVDAYNKVHGHAQKDDRNLVEIAEKNSPEIRKLQSHKGESALDEADRGLNTSGGSSGGAVPVSDKKSQVSNLKTDTSKTGDSASSSVYSDSTKATAKDSDKKDSKLQLGLGAAAVGAGAAGIGGALSYISGSKKGELKGEYDSSQTKDLSNDHSGSRNISGSSNTPNSYPVISANSTNKSKSESAAIANNSYNQGIESGSYNAGVNAKSFDEKGTKNLPKEERAEYYREGIKSGSYNAGENVGSSHAELTDKDSTELYNAGVTRGAYEAGQVKGAEDFSAEQSSGLEKTSKEKQLPGVGVAAATAAGTGTGLAAGTAYDRSHASSSKSSHDHANEESLESNNSELTVEVIGVKDKEAASRLAHKASKELSAKGVDLRTGKLVINAETREVYKAPEKSSPTATTAAPKSYTDNQFPNLLAHDRRTEEYEKAKNRLEEAGSTSGRGNDASQHPRSDGTSTMSQTAGAGAAIAAAAATGAANLHSKRNDSGLGSGTDKTSAVNSSLGTEKQALGFESNAGSTSGEKTKSDIVVTVEHTKDNAAATKIANEAVDKLKPYPEILAGAKELRIDARTGIVTNERGDVIKIPGNTKSTDFAPTSTAKENTHESSKEGSEQVNPNFSIPGSFFV
ncbi:uncharacterized protein PRCAT00002569001 [Priceomyces carsonii]|uniref:uncharacterized protein n=1 Tax=Priceomyces carsonii TaxID=28549 RepID=UPI002ED849CC|nr:unnamed protein product [Priceomyces carsonii]